MRDKVELVLIYLMLATAVTGVCYVGYRMLVALYGQ
jgi:hypothetical protein